MMVLAYASAKPQFIAYSSPYVAAPASALVESTYHGVSGAYVAAASPYVSAYSAPYVAAAPYPYAAAYTTALFK